MPKIATEAEIQHEISKAGTPTVFQIVGTSCQPCKMMEPIMEAVAKEYQGKVKFYKINAEDCEAILDEHDIRSVPSFIFMDAHGNRVVHSGAMPTSILRNKINSNCNLN